MSLSKHAPAQEMKATAERLLAEKFGGTVLLGEGTDLQGGTRNLVYRFPLLEGPDRVPASVIVKQAKDTEKFPFLPDSATIPAWTLFNEWASLQFLSGVAAAEGEVSFGPRFYGGDRATGLIVLEDLGSGRRLDELLLGHDAVAAEAALLEHAAIHGRMHAATIGRKETFQSLRESLGPSVLGDGHYTYDWFAPTFYQGIETLGVTPVAGVAEELAALRNALLQPGPFLSFVQGDSCPDNCLIVDDTMRLLDFEGGKFDHALKEGVYGRMRFPTCWCVYQIPEPIALRMEEAYRIELVKGCPEAAADKLFYRAVVEACLGWMIEWFQMVPLTKILAKDRHLIAATDRQRYLARCDVVAQVTAQFGYMEALGETIRNMSRKMRQLWSETEEMAYYPAFAMYR